VGVIIALQIINNLFIKVPEGLGTIWTRGLVVCPNNPLSTKKKFKEFLQDFEGALNYRLDALIGFMFAVAAKVNPLFGTGMGPN
jgi:hypothetical protein